VKIAIVGSGISGLVSAHLLHPQHEIVLFEARDRLGGHTHTVDVEVEGERQAIDTGFIVYNEKTYPNFVRLLSKLGVATQRTEMSFGVSCERSGLAWSSRGLGGLLAQPRNVLRPSFHRMVRDILRFNRESRQLLDNDTEKATLGDFLSGAGYSREFVDHYLVPMGAAIWSAEADTILDFPAIAFVRFFANHGLLETRPPLSWRTVVGGSARYVDRLMQPLRERVRLATPVLAIRRHEDRVDVTTQNGTEPFDHVVLAVHSDQARRLLADASPAERQVLHAIDYQRNEVVLHRDTSLLPHRARATASWNYRIPRDPTDRVLVTYDMNRLQRLESRHRFLVTLNPEGRIPEDHILGRFHYDHLIFDGGAIEAQRHHAEISGQRRTHFCGAYWGYGFHEDGVRSAIAACRPFGVEH